MKMKNKMKKQVLFMAVAGLFTSMASAADLIVRDAGAGGAFSTISAAVAQSSDGDRIIIRPKVGNLPYQENITVDKSLTFVTEIPGDKYEINGNITITTANDRVVTIQDAAMVNFTDIGAGGAVLTGRMTVNVINCIVSDDILMSAAGVTANIVGSESDMITMVHGKVVSTLTKKITITDDTSGTPSTDDLYFIANKIIYGAHGVPETPAIILTTTKYQFHILNNYIENASGNAVSINNMKVGTTNDIANNFMYFSFSNSQGIYVGGNALATVYILNNAFDNGQLTYTVDASSTPYVVAQYNIVDSSSGSFVATGNVDVSNNNSSGAYFFNSSTGIATGVILNAGNPDNTYADIDLTRNDVGPTGGSYAWSNYWTGITNRAHVFFLNTPRTIFNGTTGFPANGNATTK
jgi:hypothetical protein